MTSLLDSSLDLTDQLKVVLVLELSQRDNLVLDRAEIEELLRNEEAIIEEDTKNTGAFVGYPIRPLYREIGRQLNQWLLTRKCPLDNMKVYDLLDEKDYIMRRKELVQEISPKLEKIKTLHSVWSADELHFSIREILALLGKRGLLDLLGLRKTAGTADVWPPPRKILEDTFCQKFSPETNSPLTVGARALSKHCHRDQSSSWWGMSTGSEVAKNEHAFGKVTEILNNATWINIHQLPQDVLIIEAREEHGYGARWTADGSQFRGFLEPQMVDGHAVGWKH